MSELNDRPADASTVAVETRPEPAELDAEARAEPMSRDEYADSMRQGPPAEIDEDENEDDNDADEDASDDPGSDAQEMTREEYADDIRQGPSAETGDADRDEEPEPAGDRHDKSQVADEAAWDDPATEAQGMTRDDYADSMRQEPAAEADEPPGTDRLADQPDDDAPSPEERARLHEAYQEYLTEYTKEEGPGWEQGSNVVGEQPERSPGDTSDLPPAGQELLDMEGDKLSRFEKLRRETYKEIDDIHDISQDDGDDLAKLFDRPPMASHSEVPSGHPVFDQPAPAGVDGGHLVVAGLMVGILGVEGARYAGRLAERWKERHHGGE
jgi:hypothetical protein